MEKAIVNEIVAGLNSIATPQSLTTQIVGGIINSNYTKETVRKFLLDPVQRKITPKFKASNLRDCMTALYVLYKMCPEQTFELMEFTEENKKRIKKAENNWRPWELLYDYTPSGDDPKSGILKYNGTLIYVQYRFNDEKYLFHLSVYFIGLNAKSIFKEFNNEMESANYQNDEGYREKNKRKVPIYNFDDGRPRRSTCTVPSTIIVDHVQKELNTIIKSIQLSENISNTYSLNKTTGILLYGPHGTGKSTLVRYLAMELGRTILLTGADDLSQVISFIKDRSSYEKFIVLIEDIDFKFVDRRDSKKDDKNSEMMANTDMLFQLLDGVLAENNLVVCATTNYIDRLDPALIRDGRFDYRIEVLGLSYENAVKVCERFDVDPDEIKLKEWDTPISPATLQTFILKYKTTI